MNVNALKGLLDIKVDDIVLIAQDKMPRQFWRLGRVLKVFTSRDNKVRAAEVKVGKQNMLFEDLLINCIH